MPKAAKVDFTTISLRPLTGVLDTRSRPADIPPGSFRWKQNVICLDEGKLARRTGFARFYGDALYDNLGTLLTDINHPGTGVFYHNHDLHHQGAQREQITLLFESTESNGTRRLYAGTQSRFSVLNEANGFWTDIVTGKGAFRTRWKAAELQDVIVFVNDNEGDIYAHDLGTTTAATIPDLTNVVHVTRAKIAIQFGGFMFLMNIRQDGKNYPSRIRWSDINAPRSWDPGAADSLAGVQDLPYGDEILAAAPLLGSLYIYTRRSIWKMTVAGTTAATWSFLQVYNEPKNQTGCLVFPNTLVSTGTEHYYLSRDAIYRYSPYIDKPRREDWLHRASGVIYAKADTRLDATDCGAPVAEYHPATQEIWISWPSAGRLTNNWSLVNHTEHQTSDVVDAGFTTFANYRRTALATVCNEGQDFLGPSGRDLAIKSIGNVFLREFIAIPDNNISADLPSTAPDTIFFAEGYNTILRGLMPLGLTDREKLVRNVLFDHDTAEQDHPCVIRLRVANSYNLQDPNDHDNICAPQWRQMEDRTLACPDEQTIADMTARNLKPFTPTEWVVHEQNIFLYFEFLICNADHSPGIGGDSAFQRIDFDAMPRQKP